MADISKITLPNNSEYNLKDAYAREVLETVITTAGGTINGPLAVDNEFSANSATLGNVVVTGDATFTNDIRGNLVGTIGGYTVEKSVPSNAVFTDTTYTTFTTGAAGLAPATGSGKNTTAYFLNGSGTWTTPANTTYANFTSAAAGLVKASGSSNTTAYVLTGNHAWTSAKLTDTTYTTFTTGVAGLAPATGSGKNTTAYYLNGSGTWTTPTDTKNTAGSTDSSSKLFLIGATAQAANPQTYSHDTAYVGTNGHLYSGSKEVLVGGSNAASNVSITPSTATLYSMTSTGSVTAGTATTPAAIDTSKFSGGSFTRGTFSGGSLTMAINATDSKQLDITFTAATHAADSFTAASLASGFYTAGTKGTPTAVTLPSRGSATTVWTGYTAATAAAQTFTGATS